MTDLTRHKSGDKKKVKGSWPMGLPETNGTSNPGTFRITEKEAERLDNRDPEELGKDLTSGYDSYKRSLSKPSDRNTLGEIKSFSEWIEWSGADREVSR